MNNYVLSVIFEGLKQKILKIDSEKKNLKIDSKAVTRVEFKLFFGKD